MNLHDPILLVNNRHRLEFRRKNCYNINSASKLNTL